MSTVPAGEENRSMKIWSGVSAARRRACAALAGIALSAMPAVVPSSARADASVPEPAGYRMEDYRAPTPATLQGATIIDTQTAERLWRAKSAIFLDVLPRPEKPANLPAGTIWRDKPRPHIPGSLWLANTGYGALSADMDAYFRRGLETATGGDKAKAIVFYCLKDCWMSWNAAKRAMADAYTDVLWYPEGTDGWTAAKLPTELATPFK